MRFLLLLCGFLKVALLANIAIFTFEHSNSQSIFNNRLAEALADGCHEVFLIRPMVNSLLTIKSPVHPSIHELHSKNGYDFEIYRAFEDTKVKHMFRNSSIFESFEMSTPFFELCVHVCNNTLRDEILISRLKEVKIDLAFHHHMDFCQMALIQHLGISSRETNIEISEKWIYFSSLPPYPSLLNSAGQFVPTSVLPCKEFKKYAETLNSAYILQQGNDMSFMERSFNYFVEFLFGHFRLTRQARAQTELAKRILGDHITDLTDFPKTANLIMLGADPVIEFPIPTTRKVIYIGGLGMQRKTEKLPKEFVNFVNKAEKIVLVSFGSWSVTSKMPQSWKEALIRLFKEHPKIHFIWNCEEKLETPENVLRTVWMPQSSLLGHNKTQLLITHGGYNSLMEAAQYGVPTIAIPLFSFGDQTRNTKLFEKHGATIGIRKEAFSYEMLNDVFFTISNNQRYKTNANALQRVLTHRPSSPENEINYWVDIAINTNINLDLPNLNLFEFYSLDVILAISIILFILFKVIRLLLSWYYWSCCEMAYREKSKLE